VVGNSSGIVVLELLLKLQDAAPELKVLGQHAGAIILEFPDSKRSYVV
jgi:hypothetical protein